jgi:hypothetical protein
MTALAEVHRQLRVDLTHSLFSTPAVRFRESGRSVSRTAAGHEATFTKTNVGNNGG